MTVLVLGAGASKSYTSSPSGLQMPLARDFFRTYMHSRLKDQTWVLIHHIIGYLQLFRHSSIEEFVLRNEDIEAFHSEIEERLSASAESDRMTQVALSSASTQLVFLFAALINEIQNGPPSRPHCKLARRLRQDDCVITFNWDTLMDRALAEVTSWRCDSGYRAIPAAVYRDSWVAPQEPAAPTAPTLLKLHGSTNWITSYIMHEQGRPRLMHAASPDTLCIFEHCTKPYHTWRGRFMPGFEPYSYGYYPPNIPVPGMSADPGHVFVQFNLKFPGIPDGDAGEEGLTSMPLIIPPVREKKYDLFGELFRRIWQGAEDALATADRIVLIGYSFPITDVQSDHLFCSAFLRRETMPEVFIVDPAPERAAEKFQMAYGIASDHLTVYKAYFTEEFELDAILPKA
jgi:hypothetical protein